MGLYCKSPIEIGYIVSVYYIGYVFGACFYFVPDKYGRKRSVIVSLLLELVSETVILWTSSYHLRMAGFFFQGVFIL